MAINRFKSATAVIELIYKDSDDNVVDLTLPTIQDVEVILVNRFDGSVLDQFSRELKTGWTQAETTAEHMLMRISKAKMNAATKGLVEAQVNIIIPDNDMPEGYSVNTNKGILMSVTEAVI